MATLTQLKEKFDKAVSHINRSGIDDLIHWLETQTDFFKAPASTKFHGNYNGGLVNHSINVLEFSLNNFNWALRYKPDLGDLKESVIICSLFHDVAKVNCYKIEEKWTKNKNNQWVSYQGYKYEDNLPLPHGSKSVYLLNQYIKLTNLEALAITYHMGFSEPNSLIQGLNKFAYDSAFENTLVKIIHSADIMATSIENTIDYKANAY